MSNRVGENGVWVRSSRDRSRSGKDATDESSKRRPCREDASNMEEVQRLEWGSSTSSMKSVETDRGCHEGRERLERDASLDAPNPSIARPKTNTV